MPEQVRWPLAEELVEAVGGLRELAQRQRVVAAIRQGRLRSLGGLLILTAAAQSLHFPDREVMTSFREEYYSDHHRSSSLEHSTPAA